VSGLAIEAATAHVEVLVRDDDGNSVAHEIEEVGHGHTRRLTPLVARALATAGVEARALRWIAADLGPGSFTGVRVGLATARGFALASGATLLGASSLASLAVNAAVKRALLVPLVPGGARDAYAGFFRTDAEGRARLLAAPRVGPLEDVLAAITESRAVSGVQRVRFVGPGAARWRDALELAYPGSTEGAHRFEGLSAADLADAARAGLGPAAGLPARGEETRPLYVRSAQAEERVRHRALAAHPVTLRPFTEADVPAAVEVERAVFSDPWPANFFLGELRQPLVHARVAERDGHMAGYAVAWLGAGAGHLGNLAVIEGERRRGVARALVRELLETARARRVESLTLEVRVSNDAAQALYRVHGFRLAGVRRGYYRDTGEDALVMEWRAGA